MITLRIALRRPYIRVVLGILIILGLWGIGTVVWARLGHPTSNLTISPKEPVLSPAQPTKMQSHLLVIRSSGFEPAEVQWPKDRFFLAVDNRSNVSDITLLLDRELGGRVKEVNLKMRKQRGAGIFDLLPGRYLLTEANHPHWVCRITITPN